MSLTNYPNGLSSFGVPILGPLLTSGRVFFVHSGTGIDGAGYGDEPTRPFASIDYAVGYCTANKNDTILVLPGHVETVDAAGALDLDIAGITIQGIGNANNRPQVNFTATAADIDVDAANISIDNIRFTGGIDAVAAAIDVNAADFHLTNCVYEDVTGQCTLFLTADANTDRMLISNLKYIGAQAAGSTAAFNLTGCDNVVFEKIDLTGNFANAVIECTTTAVTNLRVRDSLFDNANSADVIVKDTITASTGFIGPNLFLSLADNAANVTEAITGATFRVFDPVYVVNLDGEKAMLINWSASTDA